MPNRLTTEQHLPTVVPAKMPTGDVPLGPPPDGSEQSLEAVRTLMPTKVYMSARSRSYLEKIPYQTRARA